MINMTRLFSCFILVMVILAAFCLPGITLAQNGEEPATENTTLPEEEEEPVPELILAPEEEEEPKIEEKVTLNALYPKVESIAGGTFEFNVEFRYIGIENKVFDVKFQAPMGWDIYMTPRYEKEKKISSVTLKPSFTSGEELRIVATAPGFPLPEPGDYKITIQAISDTISGSTEVTAVLTAYYFLAVIPTNERYNTNARAGEDNFYSIKVGNLSTDVVEDIKFSPDSPEGWSVTFNPDKIEVIEAFSEQTVEVTIKPPPKAVAGDYMISIRASGKQASADEIDVRVTVKTPTIWGWVGVGIIVVVVIGLIFVFMRFSRR